MNIGSVQERIGFLFLRRAGLLLTAGFLALTLPGCGSATMQISEDSREEAQMNKVYRDALLLACDLDNGAANGLSLYRDSETREEVIDFYTAKTGDPSIALPILAYADHFNIPLSLAFALAWTESHYTPRAVNFNADSVDRGLFQLNNNSFPELREEDFFDPEISAYHGMRYLAWCLKHGDNEVKALALYNAGIGKVRKKGAPESTLDYINKIMNYRKGLEREFAFSLTSTMGKLSTSGKKSKNIEPLVDRKKSFQ